MRSINTILRRLPFEKKENIYISNHIDRYATIISF